ncbi:hypothetical protein SPV3_ORF47, partial [Sulfolobus polyhedral virus 3]
MFSSSQPFFRGHILHLYLYSSPLSYLNLFSSSSLMMMMMMMIMMSLKNEYTE